MKNNLIFGRALLFAGSTLALALAACEDVPRLGTDSGVDGATDSGTDASAGGLSGTGANGAGAQNGSGGGFSLTGGTGSGAGGKTGSGGEDNCAESTAQADLVPANLLFVVDKSGSMNCNAPPTDEECLEPTKVDEEEPSKWEITQTALTGPTGALQTLAGQVGVSAGLIAFPLDDNCEVPGAGEVTVPIQALDAAQVDALTGGLTLSADGQTPLAGAATRGLEALRLGIHEGELTGDNYLVVMTDGAETCQPDALDKLLLYVEQAREYYGIRTYAIGAPGSEDSRALLSELAIIGGTRRSDDCAASPADASESCHIDLTESDDFEGDLGTEFKGITDATTSTCEYDVPQDALIDRKKVNVEYTPSSGDKVLIYQDPGMDGQPQCEGAEGWQFTEDGRQIVLCGEICAQVLADPGAKVRVVFGCQETKVK